MILNSLKPDLTFYLEIKPEIAFKRKGETALDRMEKEPLQFHQRVYEGYHFMAKKEKERFAVIDATKSIDEIHNQIKQRTCKLIEEFYKMRWNYFQSTGISAMHLSLLLKQIFWLVPSGFLLRFILTRISQPEYLIQKPNSLQPFVIFRILHLSCFSCIT